MLMSMIDKWFCNFLRIYLLSMREKYQFKYSVKNNFQKFPWLFQSQIVFIKFNFCKIKAKYKQKNMIMFAAMNPLINEKTLIQKINLSILRVSMNNFFFFI
jgi:hypothetical protein